MASKLATLVTMYSWSFAILFLLPVVLDVPAASAVRMGASLNDTTQMFSALSGATADEDAEGSESGYYKNTIQCFPWTKKEKPKGVYFTPNYRLAPVGTETDKSYIGSHYQLTLKSGQKIKITMPKIVLDSSASNCPPGKGMCYLKRQATGEVSKRNCFGFATHNDYGIPAGGHGRQGKSPLNMPYDSSARNVAKAMKIEGAIYLGNDEILDRVPEEELNLNTRYYIVAVYIQPGTEYHFHGLFANGWFWTSSKISGNLFNYRPTKVFPHLEDQCPSGSIFKKMKVAGTGYDVKLGGFYLFPCRNDC